MKMLEKIVVGLCVAALLGVVFGVSVVAQKVCVDYYAPWMLGTDDKQAIAYYCKPNGGAR